MIKYYKVKYNTGAIAFEKQGDTLIKFFQDFYTNISNEFIKISIKKRHFKKAYKKHKLNFKKEFGYE